MLQRMEQSYPCLVLYNSLWIIFLTLFVAKGEDDTNSCLLEWSRCHVRHLDRVILDLRSPGKIYRGRLLGILGPSGSGKTTFLNAISGGTVISKSLRFTSDINPTIKKKETAFIYQEDAFFSQLTVKETLQLAAALRLYNETNSDVINDIITFLGLDHVVNSRVGDAVSARSRGISGGERKRLAVACEMLGQQPKLLIADEPTSGLDSFSSQKVLHVLRKIAVERNVAVVCAIHQPRSSLWSLFDDIMVFATGGRLVYHGPREGVLKYFQQQGLVVPPHTNVAEYLVDLVSLDSTSPASTKASAEQIARLVDHFEATNAKTHWGRHYRGTDNDSSDDETDPKVSLLQVATKEVKQPGLFLPLRSTSRSLHRFCLLLGRALRQTMRDSVTNVARLVVSSVLASVLGAIYGGSGGGSRPSPQIRVSDSHRSSSSLRPMVASSGGPIAAALLASRTSSSRVVRRAGTGVSGNLLPLTEESIPDKISAIAQASINVGMLSMVKALQMFKREYSVVDRERAYRRYTAAEYLLSKIVAELPLDAFMGAVFGYIVHNSCAFHCDRHTFAGVLALVSCAASSLGLAVGALCPSGDTALAIGPALMVVYVILGAIGPAGAGKPLPLLLRPLQDASPFRWASKALCAAEFRGRRISPSRFSVTPSIGSRGRRRISPLALVRFLVGMTAKALTKTGQILQSLCSDNNNNNNNVVLLPHLKGSREKKTGSRIAARKAGGDYTLKALGISDSNVNRAVSVLLQMVMTHCALALAGLVINRPFAGI